MSAAGAVAACIEDLAALVEVSGGRGQVALDTLTTVLSTRDARDAVATIAYDAEAAEYAQWKFGDLEGLQVRAETHSGETFTACVGPVGHSEEQATEGWTTLALFPITEEHPDEGDKQAVRHLRIFGELRRVVVL